GMPRPAPDAAIGLVRLATGADLTFASLCAATFSRERQIQSSASVNKLVSAPLTPTFANVPPRWDANVGVGSLAYTDQSKNSGGLMSLTAPAGETPAPGRPCDSAVPSARPVMKDMAEIALATSIGLQAH